MKIHYLEIVSPDVDAVCDEPRHAQSAAGLEGVTS